MKFEHFDYQLLARYMDGECTSQERKKIEKWTRADPENQEKLQQFQRIWNTSAQNSDLLQDLFDADEQWDELLVRLENENVRHDSTFQSSSIHSMTQKVVRVAAIFLVAGLIGVLAYQNWYQPKPEVQEPVLREISTANAQRANLTLADGTEVMLNAGSTVKFPDQFEADVREVFLEGEAYFEVVRNTEKPFVVHSRGAVIKVLGTSFSVRSYPEDGQVRVVVREGRISLESENTKSTQRTFVSAEQLGRYVLDEDEKKMETAQIDDMQLYLSWREGYLKFREAPVSQVARELERRYGVEVTFSDDDIKEKSLTASLKSRSIKNVLDVITMSLDVEYRLDENNVNFYRQ